MYDCILPKETSDKMSRFQGCKNKRRRIDFAEYERKRDLLIANGFIITEIYRHAIDSAIVGAYNEKMLSLDDLTEYEVDLEACIDSVHKCPKPK